MNKPIQELSLGKCKAAIFKNEQYHSLNVKFQKSYMDKNQQWQNTEYFALTDLRDLYGLIGSMIHSQVKKRQPVQQQSQQSQQQKESLAHQDPVYNPKNYNDEEISF